MDSAGFRSDLKGIEEPRRAEIARYVEAYKHANYKMGRSRMIGLTQWLRELHADVRGSYLDIGCGRGESLQIAEDCGFETVQGTEVVDDLIRGNDRVMFAEAHALPFREDAFDVVTCLDVAEHLLPLDAEAMAYEICRVAKHEVLISASNIEEAHGPAWGLGQLHITRWPYNVWFHAFEDWAGEKFRVRYRPDITHGYTMFYQWTRRPEYDLERLDLL